ncbi:hypothetical protein EVAR_819_1, partial [Eumeta japonica]
MGAMSMENSFTRKEQTLRNIIKKNGQQRRLLHERPRTLAPVLRAATPSVLLSPPATPWRTRAAKKKNAGEYSSLHLAKLLDGSENEVIRVAKAHYMFYRSPLKTLTGHDEILQVRSKSESSKIKHNGDVYRSKIRADPGGVSREFRRQPGNFADDRVRRRRGRGKKLKPPYRVNHGLLLYGAVLRRARPLLRRKRLEKYEQWCAVDAVTQGCAGAPARCREAVMDVLGTKLRAACACRGTDFAQLYDCLGWQRLLWLNPCV